jgi:hypothetical protein
VGFVYEILHFANLSDLLREFSARGLCYLIPRKQRLPQGKMRFDGLLDLVKGEAEFPPRASWSFTPELRSSGGNVATNGDEFFCEQGNKQFPVEPSARTTGIMLRHVTYQRKTLEPLEQQFDLPLSTVQFQNLSSRTSEASRED